MEPLAMAGGHRAFTVRFDDVMVTGDALLGDRESGVAPAALRRVANAAVALGSLDLVGVGQAVSTAPSTTPSCVTSSAGRSRRSRPRSTWSPTCTSPWRRRGWPRMSAVFWIARGRTATRETAIARMHAATAARLITLDAHQLHGGMGYVTETDLHLWTERARLGSTWGGGADVAAAWLEETLDENSEEAAGEPK